MPLLYPLMIVMLVVSGIVSLIFKRKFNKYSKIPTVSGLSGQEVAEKMLRDNGILDVKVVSGQGMLSDHYNPATKTVSLSPEVFSGQSISSAAVAAHECGHAIQHATGYAWLKLRSTLVPIVQFSGSIVPFILIAGIFLINSFPELLGLGVLLFAATTLFSFITLPVEFDASKRAVQWLDTTGTVVGQEPGMVKDALKWAASTYVIAALSSLVTLLYYASIFLRRN